MKLLRTGKLYLSVLLWFYIWTTHLYRGDATENKRSRNTHVCDIKFNDKCRAEKITCLRVATLTTCFNVQKDRAQKRQQTSLTSRNLKKSFSSKERSFRMFRSAFMDTTLEFPTVNARCHVRAGRLDFTENITPLLVLLSGSVKRGSSGMELIKSGEWCEHVWVFVESVFLLTIWPHSKRYGCVLYIQTTTLELTGHLDEELKHSARSGLGNHYQSLTRSVSSHPR